MQPAVHRYGPDESQFGELWMPSGPALGTVVIIHGGFWRARYDLSLGRPLAADLASRGYTAWNLEYRRALAGGGWPETFSDVASGIDLLSSLPADTSRVVAVGHSAGGHLAVWAAGRAKLPPGTVPGCPGSPGTGPGCPGSPGTGPGCPGSPGTGPGTAGGSPGAVPPPPRVTLRGVVSQAGVLALADSAREGVGQTAALDLMGGGPDARPEEYRLADPLAAVPLDVPVLCLHSRADDAVPFSYSERYVTAARGAGGDAVLRETYGDHLTLIDPASPDWAAVIEALPGLLGLPGAGG